MKRMIPIVIGLALVLSVAATGVADPMALYDRYYSDPNPPVPFDPTWNGTSPNPPPVPDCAANPWDWPNPPYAHAVPNPNTNKCLAPPAAMPIPPPLAPGATILFGMENRRYYDKQKKVYLYIEHGGGTLGDVVVGTGYRIGDQTVKFRSDDGRNFPKPTVINVPGDPNRLIVEVPIMPQPSYEWIQVKNTSTTEAVVFSKVELTSRCNRIPSLTQWGVIALVMLLLAAGAIVIVKRRRAVVHA